MMFGWKVVIFLTAISIVVNSLGFNKVDTGCWNQFLDYIYTGLYPLILFLVYTFIAISQYTLYLNTIHIDGVVH